MNTHVCSHVVMIKTLKRVTLGVGKYEHTCLFTCGNDQDLKRVTQGVGKYEYIKQLLKKVF